MDRDRIEVTLQWIDRTLGSNRFVNVGFSLTNSQPDTGFSFRRFENALFAEMREILQLETVQELLRGVRNILKRTPAYLLKKSLRLSINTAAWVTTRQRSCRKKN